MRGLFLLLIVIPIAELMLLLEVGGRIGLLPTLAIVVGTAFIGINVLRRQGFSTLTRAQRRLEAGESPAQELIEGILLAVSGVLLLAPGLITDTLGFILLFPWLRPALARYLVKRGSFNAFGAGNAGASFTLFRADSWSQGTAEGDILDGEYIREADYERQLKPPPRE